MATKHENYINKTFEHDRSEFDKTMMLNTRAYLIADSIANGLSYRQIVSKYMKDWGVSYNYMHSIITESLNMFSNEEIYKKLKDINNERLTDIYQEARKTGDLDVAVKAIDKLNKANGIYDQPKGQVQVQTEDSNITITFGGVPLEQTQAQFNQSVTTPFQEVTDIIANALNKNEDANV